MKAKGPFEPSDATADQNITPTVIRAVFGDQKQPGWQDSFVKIRLRWPPVKILSFLGSFWAPDQNHKWLKWKPRYRGAADFLQSCIGPNVADFAGKRLRSADDIAWCMTRAPSCHLRTFFCRFRRKQWSFTNLSIIRLEFRTAFLRTI